MGDDIGKQILGWIGTAFALFFFISPFTLMMNLIKGKQDINLIPWILLMANIGNCILWAVYGYLQFEQDTQVWVCNSIGSFFNLLYLSIYFVFLVKKNVLHSIGLVSLLLVVTAGLFITFYEFATIDITGKVAMIINIIMYAAPSQKIVYIISN